jgi:hypothetical protein
MAERTDVGVVFVVIHDEDAVRIRSMINEATQSVPEGRILFVIWNQTDDWLPTIPIESIAVTSVLGEPDDREKSLWEFYGCGAARMYARKEKRPSTAVLWAGFRRKGPKAYMRIRNNKLPKAVIRDSRIPVSHNVFTRDVANNLWHLSDGEGLNSVISRIQALTTWSDEVALIFEQSSKRRKKYRELRLDEDLVPVANKIEYELPGFLFAQSGRPKSESVDQLHLF